MNPGWLILIGWSVMALIMTGFGLLQRKIGHASMVDVVWSMGVGGLSVFFAAASEGGDVQRRILASTLIMLWALRLSTYVLSRVVGLPEDGRYETLIEDWGAAAAWKMFRFYQLQALGSLLFAAPVLLASLNPEPLGVLDILGGVIWFIALTGETIADRQLDRFRKNPDNRGQVCQDGLWRYSRHPNYFFEWLHWWSYVLIAIGAPWGWLTIIGPLAMLFFVTRVTGIPPTEAQALKSRGEAYRRYQQTTNAFFPGPRRSETAEAV